MKNLNYIAIPFFVLCVLFSSCSKNTIQPNRAAREYFPNTVGDKWLYDVYDSIAHTWETVDVEITGTTTLPKGEPAKTWIYRFPRKTDTNYVLQVGDTVKIIPARNINPNAYFVQKKYILPLSAGASWVNTFIYDTIKVLYQISLTNINNLHFDSAYFIREKGPSLNYFIYAEEYFKPNIGLLQLSRYEYDFAIPDNKVWYLRQYFLK